MLCCNVEDPKEMENLARRALCSGWLGVSIRRLFVLAAAPSDVLVAERGDPEAFADDGGFDVEGVFRTGLEEAQEAFDNGGSRVVALKIYKFFAVGWRRVDEERLLRVVDEISCVYACGC